jgi:hypothetical protein
VAAVVVAVTEVAAAVVVVDTEAAWAAVAASMAVDLVVVAASTVAAVSAQPLLGVVDFAVEPSQPMVSAAAVSTTGSATTGADLRSVHLQSD